LNTNTNYTNAKNNVLSLAGILSNKGAKWNLQTCDEFVLGALNVDNYADNVFRTLETNYPNLIEIDPRSKVEIPGNNIADTYHLLDSAGANPTTTLGGFIYYSAGSPPIDWQNYLVTMYSQSLDYPTVAWDCNLIWGAGSPNHAYDFYNWGIWKPKGSSTNATANASLFYTHEPTNSIWYIGSGCPPDGTSQPTNPGSFDPSDNVSDITTPLKAFIDSIQDHQLPWDRVYNYSITINQRDFGTTLFNKLAQICDSVNAWGTSKIQWATLSEKLNHFNATSLTNSQWYCNEFWPFAQLSEKENDAQVYPIPSDGIIEVEFPELFKGSLMVLDLYGKAIKSMDIESSKFNIDLTNEPSGIYFIQLIGENNDSKIKVIKQ
jgi:hypothetical protein